MSERYEGEKIFKKIEKMREEAGKSAYKTVDALSQELGIEILMEETPDTVTVVFKGSEGNDRRMGFMKIKGLDKMIEARVRFPEDDPAIALQKLEDLKKEKNKFAPIAQW
ncbi:MAG: hypothetical protein QMD65_02750 [Patescibacteria group bacterium]|nr:hypothetical protein [Patescibacteria group bacterium]